MVKNFTVQITTRISILRRLYFIFGIRAPNLQPNPAAHHNPVRSQYIYVCFIKINRSACTCDIIAIIVNVTARFQTPHNNNDNIIYIYAATVVVGGGGVIRSCDLIKYNRGTLSAGPLYVRAELYSHTHSHSLTSIKRRYTCINIYTTHITRTYWNILWEVYANGVHDVTPAYMVCGC